MLVFAGCVQSQLVPCGELSCPAGSVCVAERCATPAQVEACAGAATGDACTIAGSVGRCDDGICTVVGCGNGVVDAGEECDDGNLAAGDGCRGDCKKLEVCGDAMLDQGEGCDDGNANSADGCDACTPTAWRATAVIGGGAQATMTAMWPERVARDVFDNVYISDQWNQRVLRVDATGVLTVFAGNGTFGVAGDGGPATSAQLADPEGLAVDGVGNVYIASRAQPVRKVDPRGIITTIDPSLIGPVVAVDGLGTLYVAATGIVRRRDPAGSITTFAGTGVSGDSGDGGSATAAQLAYVSDVALDGDGNVYLADRGNHRVRKVDPAGTITTIAGTGTGGFTGDGGPATAASLNAPTGLATDEGGNVWIADTVNHRIRRVSAAGTITTVAGGGAGGDGGPAVGAEIILPRGVVVRTNGELVIAEWSLYRVRRVDTQGVIHTLAGNGTSERSGDGGAATSAQLDEPLGVDVDGQGNIYVADTSGSRIRRVNADGTITTLAGNGAAGYGGDGGPATDAQIALPYGLAVDAAGNVWIADTYNHRVRRIDSTGVITTIAGNGVQGIAGDGGPATSAQLSLPTALALDGQGNVYIADPQGRVIRRVSPSGTITRVAGTGAFGSTGDSGPATSATFEYPRSVVLDAAGNLYIVDQSDHRVRRVDANTGIITTIAGTGAAGYAGDGGAATAASLYYPHDVAFDAAGNAYIADAQFAKIRRVDATTKLITTFAGAARGFGGDGGPAVTAMFDKPTSLAFDGQGNLFVADDDNELIRRIAADGTVTTVAGHIDPDGAGPLAQAQLPDPLALVRTGTTTWFAGGSSGRVLRADATTLAIVAGRYPQTPAIGMLARYRDQAFGTVSGIAYDEANGIVFITESTTNRIHAISIVDPAKPATWTIAPLANVDGVFGFADGAARLARFRAPTVSITRPRRGGSTSPTPETTSCAWSTSRTGSTQPR